MFIKEQMCSGHNMKHLLEILKIIDGALHSDRGKVLAYVEQLAANLEAENCTPELFPI